MKVLIVDDSIVFRSAIKTALVNSGKVEEVVVAANGKIAFEKVQREKFDAITLDLEMPVMDGIETIKHIRSVNNDIPIIIFSAQNINAANKTLTALEMGADDFVQKIEGGSDINENLKMIQDELIPRFEALLQRVSRRNPSKVANPTTTEAPSVKPVAPAIEKSQQSINLNQFKASLLCIGSSTGGPDALKYVLKKLNKLNVPLLIVQHMPPVFTTQLAKALNDISQLEVKEAATGDILAPGKCYIAPGDYHMRIIKDNNQYRIALGQDEKVCFVRPAVDVLFKSVNDTWNGNIGAVVLTGMGNDGANGCVDLKKRGSAAVLIQDQESCVVWGMPKAVYETGAYDQMLNLDKIVEYLNKMGA